MSTVYAEDTGRYCAVKIVKRGSRWSVYPLERVRCREVAYPTFTREPRFEGCTFDWSDRPAESFSYPPFEERDVVSSPQRLNLPSMHRRCSHKFRREWAPPRQASRERRGRRR